MALTLRLGFNSSTGVLDRSLCVGWASLGKRWSTNSSSLAPGWIRVPILQARAIFNPGYPSNDRCTRCTAYTAVRGFNTGFAVHNDKSFYEELEIHPQATSREVKEAFYRLSKLHHPDTNANNEESMQRFQAISEAYEVLSNASLRGKYDKGVLGRSSSVADREQSSHRFDKETFYGSRSDREQELTGSKELDDWVSTSRKDSFRKLQRNRSQLRGGVLASTSSNRIRTAAASTSRVNRKVDQGVGSGFMLFSLIILIIYFVVR